MTGMGVRHHRNAHSAVRPNWWVPNSHENWYRKRGHVNVARWLPPARIVHPWPDQRLDARPQGKSPVR